MDPIVTTALVGTARQEGVSLATGTHVDAFIDGIAGYSDERKLLLSAGALAVYRQAGQLAQQILTVPEPAAPETLRACPPATALLLSRLLNGEQAELLPEALTRLREAGVYLPYHLLPLALSKTGKELRSVLFPVLGARGRWLSQFNSAWKWVGNFLASTESGLPTDAETIWQEGTTGQRVEILRRLRAVDPTRALTWLEDVWKQEKAEVRCDLLQALEVGLGAPDEAFLERALDDRAPSVRQVAANLLTHLPTSALVARMCERGSTMLKLAKGKLGLELPATFAKEWQRDGLMEKTPKGQNLRAWWLIQVLAAIPPSYWESRFAAGPAELLALLPDNEWSVDIADGWSRSALKHRATHWLMPLWQWWQACLAKKKQTDMSDANLCERILQAMPQAEAEQVVLALLHEKSDEGTTLLSSLPRPWSQAFAQAYLSLLRAYYQKLRQQPPKNHPHYDPWIRSLSVAALALPVTCLAEAQQRWEPLEEDEDGNSSWQIRSLNELFQTFVTTTQFRQKIYEEII